VLILNACATTLAVPVTATEDALCRVWGESLATRSRADTEQTQAEIGQSYADFAAACPDYAQLVP
jgi:hypothetical protein